jgi:hypothetical protein
MIHWSFIGLVSFIMTTVYCMKGHGICRPQPMLFYFNDSWQETKFQRDPTSLTFILCFILTVSVMQIAIEIKKRKLMHDSEKASRDAAAAKRGLDEAKRQLRMKETVRERKLMKNKKKDI